MALFVTCPHCNGEGQWESEPHGHNHWNGEPLTYTTYCSVCDGAGTIEDEPEPQTLEDALMLDAEILRAKGVDVDDPIFFEESDQWEIEA